MSRPWGILLAALAFAAGWWLGPWQQPRSIEARALTRTEADNAYRELEGDDGALVQGSRRLARIVRLATPSVVHIQSERPGVARARIQETGSGVLITSDRMPGVFVVTNRHVVVSADLKDVTIHLHDGRVIGPRQVWTDPATDVAVLKVEAPDLQPARWGDSDALDIGSMVLAMGSPFGLSESVTFGIVSAKGRRSLKLGPARTVLNQDFLQTDAAINPGNSGGPLIDLHGRVVALNTAIASNSGSNSGIGFSIPSNLVRRVMDQLLEFGKVQRAYLGVRLDDEFDLDDARDRRLDRLRGALVAEVYPGTPAALARLQAGDIVLSFRGIAVQDHDHLIHLVSLTPIGTRANLAVMRDGREITLAVELADRSDLEQQSSSLPVRTAPPRYPAFPTGFEVTTLDEGLAVQAGCGPAARGVLVLAVEPGEFETSAGLQPFDVIDEVARTPVASLEEFRDRWDDQAGGPVLLTVVRAGKHGPERRAVVCSKAAHADDCHSSDASHRQAPST